MTEQPPKKTRAQLLMEMGYNIAPCRGCGVPVVWAVNPAGVTIPLSTRIPVYGLVRNGSNWSAVPTTLAAASHFVDCPKRELFKK